MPGLNLDLPKKRYMKINAHVFKRIIAYILDLSILLIIMWPIVAVLKNVVHIPDTGSVIDQYIFIIKNPSLFNMLFIVEIVEFIIFFIYFTALEYKINQSIGKLIMNISVESEKDKLSLWQVGLRNIYLIPIIPFNLLQIIDPILMIFRKDHKRLSDIFSKTKVVENIAIH
ncbi:MAG: RDD family protein [Candidatus Woesearchaeota archaeon]